MYQEQLNQISQSLAQISERFDQPFYLFPEFWTVLVALLIGIASPIFTEWLTRRPKKSELVVEGVRTITQENNSAMEAIPPLEATRLVITNKGRHKANAVEAYIQAVFDEGEERKDFIPMPLMWTHGHLAHNGSVTVRDIYPNQTVYLDVLNTIYDPLYVGDMSTLFATPTGTETDTLSKIVRGNSKITITLYQESGQVNVVKLDVYWDNSNLLLVSLVTNV